MRFLFALLRLAADARAVRRGRVRQRLWNRLVSKATRGAARRLYR